MSECAHCSETFERLATAKYCSPQCKSKANYHSHRAQRIAAMKAYRVKNKETIRAAKRAWYAKNKARVNEQAKGYRKRHKDRLARKAYERYIAKKPKPEVVIDKAVLPPPDIYRLWPVPLTDSRPAALANDYLLNSNE